MELASPTTIEIERDPERCGGDPVLAGTRMGVHNIVSHVQRNGGDVRRVVEDFPYLTVEVIEAVMAWYRDHKEEIDEIMHRHREASLGVLAETRSRAGQ